MENILIRKMVYADIKDAAIIFQKAYAGEPWSENWSFDDATARIADYYHYPNSRCYVAFSEKQMIGGLLCDVLRWCKGRQIEIKEFFVLPEFQNTGIGSSLFKTMEDNAIAEGIGEIIFWTDIHPKMQSFYCKQGCSITDGAVVMHKEI